ncbi:hypothetical protein OS493_019807 [Desmophyllum pertusum]|uniref:Torsin-1A-interacting protein 1/2 AAA+ activator domain-containing protein n=1 Tax=Desmophyllum pertusum TaxID=174260 RepID=A0A9X0CQX3_9CNID|nr:hypothetical protein OS493_019807 [Desmophyllum pertusum]
MASKSSVEDSDKKELETTKEVKKPEDASRHSEEENTGDVGDEESPSQAANEVDKKAHPLLKEPTSNEKDKGKGKTKTKTKPKTDNETEHDTQPKPATSLGNISSSAVVLISISGVIIMIAVSIALYNDPPKPEMKSDFDLVKVFGNGLEELQSSFTNQTERFWRILKNRGLAHLRNTNPSQPLVFLLAAPPPAHDVVDCLAIKLAEKLDPRHKRNLATIDGTEEKSYPADSSKRKMDDLLKDKFLAGHRVALIPSSGAPPTSITTIVLLVLRRSECNRINSRIADTVALMNGESSDSVKAFCS